MQKPATTMQFVRITPGEFMMGCSPGDEQCGDDEKPSHRVRITKGFDLGKFEVTQTEWLAVMGNNPSEFAAPNHPVEHVSYFAISAAVDPTGPPQTRERAMRGGSWLNVPENSRISKRDHFEPEFSDFHIGFRVVREAFA